MKSMKSIVAFAFTLVLATSCSLFNHKHDQAEAKEEQVAKSIQFRSGACFGQCPVFTCTLNNDGTATFTGKNFVDFEGEHTAQVDGATVEGWIQRAEEIGFFTLEKEYDNPNVSDLPEKETTITVGEKSHTIRSRYGVPDALRSWEKGLMQYVLKEIEWKKTAK